MMLNLYVQQHQWIVITLLGGTALMLLFCLTYLAMWRPRHIESKSQLIKPNGLTGLFYLARSFVPLVLVILALACVSFTIATVLAKACRPPNW
jgi:F0F1-type ATP synthase assembly protein I